MKATQRIRSCRHFTLFGVKSVIIFAKIVVIFVIVCYKGALTEQYVCQQLKIIEDLGVYYYTNDRGSCEVDFVVDTGDLIIPLEVKAEVNLKAKSLKTYQEKFSPEVSVLTAMTDYKKEDWLITLPLYAIEQITKL